MWKQIHTIYWTNFVKLKLCKLCSVAGYNCYPAKFNETKFEGFKMKLNLLINLCSKRLIVELTNYCDMPFVRLVTCHSQINFKYQVIFIGMSGNFTLKIYKQQRRCKGRMFILRRSFLYIYSLVNSRTA